MVPMSKTFKEIHQKIKARFPDKVFYLVDFDDHENHFLLVIQSDQLYGQYYDFNSSTGEIMLIYDLMPQLKEEDMAPMIPIEFKARDGMKIYGYITLPKSTGKNKNSP